MKSTLTSKGQITLPGKLRKKLNLHPGDQVDFIINEEDEILLKVRKSSLRRLKGMVQKSDVSVSLRDMEKAIGEEAGKL